MATTIRISDRREEMIEFIALRAGEKCNRKVKMAEIMHFLIDRYLNLENEEEMIEAFKEKDLQKKRKKAFK